MTAGTSSARRTTIATHSTSICWRSPSRVRPPIRWRRRSPRRSSALAEYRAHDGRRRRAAADDWRRRRRQLVSHLRTAAVDCSDSLQVAAQLLDRPELAVGPPAEEAIWMTGAAPPSGRGAPVRSTALRASGYFVSRSERGDHLVIDAGPHGYLNGGHAHADALSVTLTVRGRPFLIDPGTACYTIDPELRDRFRSTSVSQHPHGRRTVAVAGCRPVPLALDGRAPRRTTGAASRAGHLRGDARRLRPARPSASGARARRAAGLSSIGFSAGGHTSLKRTGISTRRGRQRAPGRARFAPSTLRESSSGCCRCTTTGRRFAAAGHAPGLVRSGVRHRSCRQRPFARNARQRRPSRWSPSSSRPPRSQRPRPVDAHQRTVASHCSRSRGLYKCVALQVSSTSAGAAMPMMWSGNGTPCGDVRRHPSPRSRRRRQFVGDGAALGMRRLSIIDLAGGHQPIHNEDGTVWVVFNGEIYNYRELRAELERRGHRFYTHSDTETIVHAYEEWGEDAFARLRGMFGIALWDAAARTLLLARDRAGHQAAVLRASTAAGCTSARRSSRCWRRATSSARSIRRRSITTSSFLYTPRDRVDLQRHPQAAARTSARGGTTAQSRGPALLADLPPHETFTGIDGRRRRGARRRVLADAVTSHMVSDVPLGAFLSGGVDSSLVVALMARGVGAAGQDLLDRLRRAGLRRARRTRARWRSTSAPTTTSSSSGPMR